jgi:hypothetical protein
MQTGKAVGMCTLEMALQELNLPKSVLGGTTGAHAA